MKSQEQTAAQAVALHGFSSSSLLLLLLLTSWRPLLVGEVSAKFCG
jgi:hypothetical protein